MTSYQRSVFLENTEVAYFDSSNANSAEWTVINPAVLTPRSRDAVVGSAASGAGGGGQPPLRVTGRILAGDSALELVEQFTLWAGRMPALPEWALSGGAVVGFEGGTAAVRSVWAQLQAAGVPLSAFWLQDWTGRRDDAGDQRLWWNWELDEDYYPGEWVLGWRAGSVVRTIWCVPRDLALCARISLSPPGPVWAPFGALPSAPDMA